MKSSESLALGWLLALAALGASSCVFAQEAGANTPQAVNPDGTKAGEQPGPAFDTPQPQPKGKADKRAATPAQQQPKPPPRRHVWQAVGPEPTVNLGPVYSPTLTPRPPTAPMPGPAPVQPGPAQLNSCVGNLCTDASGSQYNAGVGNAGVNSQGRLCNWVGTTMQCF
jgi:hypothetical protein